MDVAWAYGVMVLLTVVTPGPGQLMTVGNALRQGWWAAMCGVAGLSLGTVCMASVSALGVGRVLQTHPQTVNMLRWLGAAYLVYMAQVAWRQASVAMPPLLAGSASRTGTATAWTLLVRGWVLQLTNPKPVFFFLAVLPPLAMDAASGRWVPWRAVAAVGGYVLALLLIHGTLAALVLRLRTAVPQRPVQRWLRRGSAVCFVLFAVLLVAR